MHSVLGLKLLNVSYFTTKMYDMRNCVNCCSLVVRVVKRYKRYYYLKIDL